MTKTNEKKIEKLRKEGEKLAQQLETMMNSK